MVSVTSQMAQLGWYPTRNTYSLEYHRRDKAEAEVYQTFGRGRWHAIYTPKEGGLRQLQLFDDPVSAAIWLNVELAGE